jgi:hypothetical protein
MPTPSISEGWRKNGRYAQTRRSPLPDGGWVTLLLDLTDRRETEEALRRAKDSDFLAHMSHELRTPLNAVIGFSEIIFRELFGSVGEPRYAEYARDIHASGTHLMKVIDDILDISKAEAGSAELDEGPVDVAELASASLRLVEPRATAGKVSVARRLAPDLPVIRADARRLKRCRTRSSSRRRAATSNSKRGSWRAAAWSWLCATPASAWTPRTFRAPSSRSRRSTTRCRAATKAPGSVCRCRASSSNSTAAP